MQAPEASLEPPAAPDPEVTGAPPPLPLEGSHDSHQVPVVNASLVQEPAPVDIAPALDEHDDSWTNTLRAIRGEEAEDAPAFMIGETLCKAKAVGEQLVIRGTQHAAIYLWCFNDVFDAAYAAVNPSGNKNLEEPVPQSVAPPPTDGGPAQEASKPPGQILKASIQKYAKRLRQKVGVSAFIHQDPSPVRVCPRRATGACLRVRVPEQAAQSACPARGCLSASPARAPQVDGVLSDRDGAAARKGVYCIEAGGVPGLLAMMDVEPAAIRAAYSEMTAPRKPRRPVQKMTPKASARPAPRAPARLRVRSAHQGFCMCMCRRSKCGSRTMRTASRCSACCAHTPSSWRTRCRTSRTHSSKPSTVRAPRPCAPCQRAPRDGGPCADGAQPLSGAARRAGITTPQTVTGEPATKRRKVQPRSGPAGARFLSRQAGRQARRRPA